MSDQQRHGDVPSYPQRPEGGWDQDAYDAPQRGGYQDAYGSRQDGYGQPQQGWDPMAGPRTGPRMFPFPSWTTRTRGGSTVTVGGCCLPLPIGCLATTLAVGAVATSRVVRHVRG